MQGTGHRERGRRRPRILIAGGGTGGHVYPGLAVAEALVALAPAAEVRFAGTRRGLESVLVPREGWRLHHVPASGFRGLGPLARLRFLGNFVLGLVAGLALLVAWRPGAVLGTGGYVSAPVLAAARLLRVPCALQEQNALPGSANRLLARWARRIYLGFAAAREHFPGRECLVTGNPVRTGFTDAGARPPADDKEVPPRAAEAGDEKELRLLVFGGSRGARTLNEAVSAAGPLWRERPRLAVWIQTGPAAQDTVRDALEGIAPDRIKVVPYLFRMDAALAWADLAVCRAGAMTLAELEAMGRPAILVPFPHATDDHQLANARDCEAAGSALVLLDAECDAGSLVRLVDELAADRPRLGRMAAAAAARGRPGAAHEIAADLLRLAGAAPDPEGSA
jgi:UDP-N-acetylglucosamine--N-acetylmuramyl-(pentapeptide) pyrophosphoryl-undecaprenol N-acetylglucosamine transferase